MGRRRPGSPTRRAAPAGRQVATPERTLALVQPYPPPPRNRTGRTVLIVVGIVVLVGCLCAGGFGFFLYRSLNTASAQPRAAVHTFVGDLAAGDANAAYDELCRRTQAGYSRADFTSFVSSQPRPTKAKITGFDISGNAAQIKTTLSLADGRNQLHTFELARDAGVWRVCGNPY
jgi:hypothetical protein